MNGITDRHPFRYLQERITQTNHLDRFVKGSLRSNELTIGGHLPYP
jgi:hypothetical protein